MAGQPRASQSRPVPCETCRQKKLVCKMIERNGIQQCERCTQKQLECSGPRRTEAYFERIAKKGSDNSKRRPIAPPVHIPPHTPYDNSLHVSPGFVSSPLSPAPFSSLSPGAPFLAPQQGSYSSNHSMSHPPSVPYHFPQQPHFAASNGAPHPSAQRFGESYSPQGHYTADGNMYASGYDLNQVYSTSFYRQ